MVDFVPNSIAGIVSLSLIRNPSSYRQCCSVDTASGTQANVNDSFALLQCFNELAIKSEKWNGKPDWNVSLVDIHLRELLWVYCPGQAGMKGNDQADRLAGKASLTSGLRLGRSKVLRSLRQYLRTQSQGHHNIDRLEERSVEGGSARRSS